MKSLLKFLGLAAVIVLGGLWIMTVAKSCDTNKLAGTTNLESSASDKITEVKDDVESLFEGEPEEEGLFNEEGGEPSTSVGDDEDDHDEGDDDHDEGDDEGADSDLQAEIAARQKAGNSSGGGSGSASTTAARNSGGMEYLVIGGAYITEVNANAEVKRLKKKGYSNAEVVTFDFSQYHSVCVKRTSSRSDARAIKDKLVKGGNPEAYVHKKRRYLKK